MSKPRCPDCHHDWAFHYGPCQVDGCDCEGLAALAAVSGIETLVAIDDAWQPVTVVFGLRDAARFSRALRGRMGGDRYRAAWRFLLRHLEAAKDPGFKQGEFRRAEGPPL